jgi:hypothetical protein
MATLHFICGKAASGKTKLARELAARHAAVLFGEDEWLTLLDAEINSLADHVRHSKRLKAALAPLCCPAASVGCADRVRFRRQHAERPCLGSIDIRKRQRRPCAALYRRVR